MKPGKQTTEFYLTLAAMAGFVLNGTTFVNIPWDQMPYFLALAGGYTVARSWVKQGPAKEGTAS